MQSLQLDEIEATIKTADELWAAYRKQKKNAEWMKKSTTEKITYFQSTGFSNFITKYTIPTRYMVMYDEYSHTAFKKYLIRLKTVGYRSKDEWVDRQADYVKLLWRAYNPRGSAREAGEARQMAYENIKREMDGFENDYERAKVKAESRRVAATRDNRAMLLDLLRDRGVQTILENKLPQPAPMPIPEPEPEPEWTQLADDIEPVHEPAVENIKLSETQRRNAARRKREKIKRAIDALPPVPTPDPRRQARDALRESRRVERSRAKILETEQEKDRMRKHWEETRRAPVAKSLETFTFDDADEIYDLPSD